MKGGGVHYFLLTVECQWRSAVAFTAGCVSSLLPVRTASTTPLSSPSSGGGHAVVTVKQEPKRPDVSNSKVPVNTATVMDIAKSRQRASVSRSKGSGDLELALAVVDRSGGGNQLRVVLLCVVL